MTEAAKILLALVQFAPEVRGVICRFWSCHTVDLGPVPPDLREDFAAVDKEIDEALKGRQR